MRRSLLVTVLAAAAVLPAVAADDPLEPPDLDRYLRWGVLRVRPGIGLTNLGKDDNVFFATGNEPRDTDYRVTISPRLEGLVLFGDRAFLEFNETLDYTHYFEFTEQDYLNQAFTSRVTFPFSRFGVFADLDLIRRQNRPTSEFDIRLEQRQRRAGAGVIVELGWRTYAEIRHVLADWSFDDPDNPSVADELDRVERSNELTLNYRLTGQSRLTFDTLSKKYDFDDPSQGRDASERRLVPGIVFGEGARIRGVLKLGVSTLDFKDRDKRDFNGLVGEADLTYRLGTGTRLDLGLLRDVGFAVFGNRDLYVDRSVRIGAIHYLNRVIGLDSSRTWGDLGFPRTRPTGQDPRDDTLREYEFGLRLRIALGDLANAPHYRLFWGRWRRNTEPDVPVDLDQTRNVWGFSAVVGF